MTIVVDVGAKIVQAEYNGKKNGIFLAVVEAPPILPERRHAEVKANDLLSILQKKWFLGQFDRGRSAKNGPKTKIVAFLFFNVNNIYYFCTRKIVKYIKLTQYNGKKTESKCPHNARRGE